MLLLWSKKGKYYGHVINDIRNCSREPRYNKRYEAYYFYCMGLCCGLVFVFNIYYIKEVNFGGKFFDELNQLIIEHFKSVLE